MSVVQISAVTFSLISLLLLLISLGSNYWVLLYPTHSGLWKVCIDTSCTSYPTDVGDVIRATRAFLLIGIIPGAISFFGLCATCCKSHLGSISLARISAVAGIIAALSVLIAMVIFTENVRGQLTYGWSFGLGWASMVLFLITGFLAYKLQPGTS
ncbi:protein NKG7-like [Elgaria multicarinata webbii]|uniref:protein NKG7-like n=1 Tax=Elgaria multicarinata webbii TaxID=159646 RepID=UPI002FCCED39